MKIETRNQKLKIKIIPLLIAVSLLPSVLHAGEYKQIWDSTMLEVTSEYNGKLYTGTPFKFKQIGSVTCFSATVVEAFYFAIANNNVKKDFDWKSCVIYFLDPDPPDLNDWEKKTFIMQAAAWGKLITSPYDTVIKSGRYLLFIKNLTTSPAFTKLVSWETLPGAKNSDAFRGFHTLKIKDTVFRFWISTMGLHKMNFDMTAELAYYKFPSPYAVMFLDQCIIAATDSSLWIQTDAWTSLLEFNFINEQWTIYDSTNLPISWKTNEWSQQKIKTSFAYSIISDAFLWEEYNPKPIIPITSYYWNIEGHSTDSSYFVDTSYFVDNALLYFNQDIDQWDTIRIDLSKIEAFKNDNGYRTIYCYPIRSFGKILIRTYPTTADGWKLNDPMDGKYLVFDWKTKTFEEPLFAPPDSLFSDGVVQETPSHIDCFTDASGEKCIGLLYNKDFITYKPTLGIYENVNAGLIPDLWFRKVYPNPAPQRTVNADIMCYVPDLRKISISLYNLLGDKMLDLTNNYEYNDATKTIYVTFNVPPDFPTGTYYLNVNNGTEYRTKAIVIGQ